MTRKSTFHRDVQNSGDLSMGKPVHQYRGANRNRKTEATLHPRELLENINPCVIFVLCASGEAIGSTL
jgi:hypothetical protein